jgi:hypothetical protein
VVLIVSNIANTTIKYLTHLEDASSCRVLCPEVFWNLWYRVNADSIEVVF